MAGRGNPSYQKNQKAQKRVARANAKRAARQARHAERAANRAGAATESPPSVEDGTPPDENPPVEGGAGGSPTA